MRPETRVHSVAVQDPTRAHDARGVGIQPKASSLGWETAYNMAAANGLTFRRAPVRRSLSLPDTYALRPSIQGWNKSPPETK